MNENKQNPNTSPKESFQERQDNELAALMVIHYLNSQSCAIPNHIALEFCFSLTVNF